MLCTLAYYSNVQARTNIPGPSSRTLRTYIAESALKTDARIQVCLSS